MRTYNELTEDQQGEAQEVCLINLLQAVVDGNIRFDDESNQDYLQARIEAAVEKSVDNQTPWFAWEYILDACEDDLRSIALADAEDSLYSGPDEHVIAGVVAE